MIHGQKRVKKVESWWIYELNLSFPLVVSQVILAAFIKRRVGGWFYCNEIHYALQQNKNQII